MNVYGGVRLSENLWTEYNIGKILRTRWYNKQLKTEKEN